MKTQTEPALITAEVLAARWSRSEAALANDRQKGKGIPYLKFGGAVRYAMADVLAAEKNNRVEVAS